MYDKLKGVSISSVLPDDNDIELSTHMTHFKLRNRDN